MNKIIRYVWLFIMLQLIMEAGKAQNYHTYQSTNAVLLQLNESAQTESRLDQSFITLSGTNVLKVRARIPYQSISYKPADNTVSPSLGLAFNLTININPNQIQDDL